MGSGPEAAPCFWEQGVLKARASSHLHPRPHPFHRESRALLCRGSWVFSQSRPSPAHLLLTSTWHLKVFYCLVRKANLGTNSPPPPQENLARDLPSCTTVKGSSCSWTSLKTPKPQHVLVPGGLVHTRGAGPQPLGFPSSRSVVGPQICICSWFPHNADAVLWGIHFENCCLRCHGLYFSPALSFLSSLLGQPPQITLSPCCPGPAHHKTFQSQGLGSGSCCRECPPPTSHGYSSFESKQ